MEESLSSLTAHPTKSCSKEDAGVKMHHSAKMYKNLFKLWGLFYVLCSLPNNLMLQISNSLIMLLLHFKEGGTKTESSLPENKQKNL